MKIHILDYWGLKTVGNHHYIAYATINLPPQFSESLVLMNYELFSSRDI